MFKKEVCMYCHCVLFCFQVQCTDPWKLSYQVASSIITYNTGGISPEGYRFSEASVPHRKPDKFIEFYNKSEINISSHEITLDNVAHDEVFIRGNMDFHTADISSKDLEIYTISKKITELYPETAKSISVQSDKWSVNTTSSGFKEDGEVDHFFIYGIQGQQDEVGNGFCNIATKYYDWRTRAGKHFCCPGKTGVLSSPWLYTDIPDRIPMHGTPTITSFDIGEVPSTYFDDVRDPLIIMYKNIYYQTVMKKKPTDPSLELNGNGSVRLPYGAYGRLFEGKPISERFYPFIWCDRVVVKIVKAPYNLYVRSGESEFKECALGETLTDLKPGRYYFPNPYSDLISNTSAYVGPNGEFKNAVHDEENFKEYFQTELPHQFIEDGGGSSMAARYDYAKRMLGDPTTSKPLSIEHWPRVRLAKIDDLEIKDWTKEESYGEESVVDSSVIPILNANKTAFNAGLSEEWKPVFDTI